MASQAIPKILTVSSRGVITKALIRLVHPMMRVMRDMMRVVISQMWHLRMQPGETPTQAGINLILVTQRRPAGAIQLIHRLAAIVGIPIPLWMMTLGQINPAMFPKRHLKDIPVILVDLPITIRHVTTTMTGATKTNACKSATLDYAKFSRLL